LDGVSFFSKNFDICPKILTYVPFVHGGKTGG
jgi:hypothetical protein